MCVITRTTLSPNDNPWTPVLTLTLTLAFTFTLTLTLTLTPTLTLILSLTLILTLTFILKQTSTHRFLNPSTPPKMHFLVFFHQF